MPIYEFYCPDCHTIFNFFSARIETEKRPDCPRCGRSKLERRMSVFSHLNPAVGLRRKQVGCFCG